MSTIEVNVKSFEFGTKLEVTFVVENAQHVQRLILLPTVDSVESLSGELTYSNNDQLLGLGEYYGTIGPNDVALDFVNGVRLRAKLKTPMDHQIAVKVTADDTSEQRKPLEQRFGHRTSHLPLPESGLAPKFKPAHVYVDYLLGPSHFFWPFRIIPQMTMGTLARTESSSHFIATFDIDGVIYEFTADIVPSIQTFESTAAVLSYQNVRQLIGTQTFHGRIGIEAASIIFEKGASITATLGAAVDPASTIVGAGHWTEA